MASFGPQDQFIVYSDVPPLGNEGVSMAVLAHRIIASLEPNVAQVITRAASRKYPRHLIGTKLQAPTLLSWDCGKWLRFLRGETRVRADAILLRAWLRLAYRRPQSDRAVEVLGLSGPHWQFLPRLRDVARAARLPYSVYVVDDYEITADHSGADELKLQNTQRGIRECLQQARRVFSICPGMAERLQARYDVASQVLYPVADDVGQIAAAAPANASQELVYVGSLGGSYLDVLESVATLLESGGAPGWRLKIISQDRRTFDRVFGGQKIVIGRHDCNREQLRQEIAAAEAVLIPYSFDARWKTTAETSFPSKFMDAIVAGKPIVVFAPSYASIVRHMQAADCGFCVGSAADCGQLLTTRPWLQSETWRAAYHALLQRHHTASAARGVLLM